MTAAAALNNLCRISLTDSIGITVGVQITYRHILDTPVARIVGNGYGVASVAVSSEAIVVIYNRVIVIANNRHALDSRHAVRNIKAYLLASAAAGVGNTVNHRRYGISLVGQFIIIQFTAAVTEIQ